MLALFDHLLIILWQLHVDKYTQAKMKLFNFNFRFQSAAGFDY